MILCVSTFLTIIVVNDVCLVCVGRLILFSRSSDVVSAGSIVDLCNAHFFLSKRSVSCYLFQVYLSSHQGRVNLQPFANCWEHLQYGSSVALQVVPTGNEKCMYLQDSGFFTDTTLLANSE